MQLDRRVAVLHEALEGARRRGGLPAGSVLLAYGGEQRRVPSHGGATCVLRTLQAACQLVEQLGPAVHAASAQLLAQLAHSFFMPLCLTALAALARIQVLAGQLMLDAVRAYNVLADAAALLPPGPAAAAAAAGEHGKAARGHVQRGDALPQLLHARWRRGLPHLELTLCPPGESLAEQAAAACARYALHLACPFTAVSLRVQHWLLRDGYLSV
ncbi:hypothetical protein C2E20_3076 [Micractinium conductrix]|uniref:Nucleolus and neural progenitor protein-like N-terminal domain-containing protein n=1 Tax=Micractinium conductrix TaxID=554055 RepID=A0A2P6VHT9_9CHLO|nr:hypothetical protein C2E20_3076 [Micractinium conductrix]|eukprot:PSC73627.1 hypothetical protein C2E20_3076 [Micractinium conductrix]